MCTPTVINLYRHFTHHGIRYKSYNGLSTNYKNNTIYKDCIINCYIDTISTKVPIILKYITSFKFDNYNFKLSYCLISKQSKLRQHKLFTELINDEPFYKDNYHRIIKWIPLNKIKNKLIYLKHNNNLILIERFYF